MRTLSQPHERIPVIILNWNGEEDTIECLQSIQGAGPAGFVPVVVDNGSSPESLAKLKGACSQMFSATVFLRRSEVEKAGHETQAEFGNYLADSCPIFIENGANLGFARGNNVGARFAELAGAQWVMLLNNDTVVAPGLFQQLKCFIEAHPEFPAVTPQIRDFAPRTRIQNCGGDLTYFGSRKYRLAGRDAADAPKGEFSVVSFVTGCALLFNFKLTGMLSERFFFGEEDYEFSLRMKQRGMPIACVHDAVVYHKGGSSIAKSAQPLGNILVYYVNRLINTRTYYSKPRWHATRILAYLYLPFLLARKGIDLRKSIAAISTVESYVKKDLGVDGADFKAMIGLS